VGAAGSARSGLNRAEHYGRAHGRKLQDSPAALDRLNRASASLAGGG
jgi:hypothetical protein